jgi:hypothetical protein
MLLNEGLCASAHHASVTFAIDALHELRGAVHGLRASTVSKALTIESASGVTAAAATSWPVCLFRTTQGALGTISSPTIQCLPAYYLVCLFFCSLMSVVCGVRKPESDRPESCTRACNRVSMCGTCAAVDHGPGCLCHHSTGTPLDYVMLRNPEGVAVGAPSLLDPAA